MKYKEIIKDKINQLISGYPEPCKPLILKHFDDAFKAIDDMDNHINELLEYNSALMKRYDDLQNKYIKLQTIMEFKNKGRKK